MFQWLRNQGHPWNHKRVYRIYRELRLNLRIKPKRRLPSRHPDKLATPARPNDTWSVDFMTDTLETNQRFRTLNIIDDFNREVVHIEVGPSIPAQRVMRALNSQLSNMATHDACAQITARNLFRRRSAIGVLRGR